MSPRKDCVTVVDWSEVDPMNHLPCDIFVILTYNTYTIKTQAIKWQNSRNVERC